MSVLIKGMEMPKNCARCFVGDRRICRDECPLVEVPPHGDLIDAFAFRREMDANYPFDKFTQSKHGEADAAKSTILMMLRKAPTIIEAEEET